MSTQSFQHALYPMDTGFYNSLGNYTLESRCAIAADLGFADTYLTLWSPEAWEDLGRLKTVSADHGLGVAGVYHILQLDQLDESAALGKIEEILEHLPQGAVLELAVQDSVASPFGKSAEAGDGLLLPFLAAVMARADRSGHEVSLYPHIDFWLERIEDAVRLCGQLGHPRLGLNFNAFHWYAVDGTGLDEKLAKAAPYLKLVTLNGSRQTDAGLGATIEPLDQGELDLFAVLGALRREAGFRGKIGFQGYSWGGDIHAKLERSLGYFRRMEDRLNRHPEWAILDRRPGPPLRRG